MNNLVSKETTKEDFKKSYIDYPDTAPDGFKPFHESRVRPIYWDIPDGVSILDVGCNSGEFMKRLLKGKKNVTVKGIDVSESVVKIAKEKGLDVVLGDGEDLPFDDSSFDYVVLMEVLVHVHDPKKLLSEIKRVLKKDGVLIGSCPHANLEKQIWDDQRLHHAYYTTEDLHELLDLYFYRVWTKVLTGGQFSVGMAGSYLGDKDVEILFKCGGENTPRWDYKLYDRSFLRVWMGPTQGPGDVYYRMSGFADKMNSHRKCDVVYNRFDYNEQTSPGEWQKALSRTENNLPANPIVLNQMEGLLKIADISVWQLTWSWSVLAFFKTLKHVHPKKPFVTEMDDWLFDIPGYNLASSPYKPNSEMERIAWEQIQMSDAMIVSTDFIKDHMRHLLGKKIPIYVIRNAIDFDIWDALKKPEKDDKIRIGYTGCGNHSGDLEFVKKPILAILDEFPNVEVIMSVPFKSWDDVNHPRVKRSSVWSNIHAFPQMVTNWNLDIGIAPLRDSNFNRAKSNLRWLEYSAMKIPTVASRVYPFEKTIRKGVDGFVCASQKEWYESLKELIEDPGRRSAMGEAAYQRVKKDFNMTTVASEYRSILEGIKYGSR